MRKTACNCFKFKVPATAARDREHDMEMERVEEETKKVKKERLLLLVFNIAMMITGGTAGGLLIRLYFLHGGSRKWLAAGLQTAGFPFLLIPLLFSYIRRGCRGPLLRLTPPLLLWCAFLGLLTGVDNFMYSYGASSLPVSTSSLLLTTQLGFTALFSFFLVRQRFTDLSVNAVVLLTLGAAVIGVHAGGDRPEGLSQRKYFLGFFLTLTAAVSYSCVPPLLQLMYAKASRHPVAYALVVETQLAIGFFATAFCALGMALNRDFQAIGREAREYGLGEAKYYVAIISIAFVSNMFLLGLVGTINASSALLSGIAVSVCLPATEVLAVIFFREKFDGEKGVAVALSIWGTASYLYGEYKESISMKKMAENDAVSSIQIRE